ncbi:hypothetical protein KJA15_04430 [Patescibacteria group bacterium]|nr:hypothetical protein [Patescibacteria group bacterium]
MNFDLRNSKLKVGVDIDGVLGDQVSPVLSKIHEKYDIILEKKDIIEWDFEFGNTNIEIEINNALLCRDFVLNMPVINGAKDGIKYLQKNYSVFIASSRPKKTEKETLQWLSSEFNIYGYINTRNINKGSLEFDILIDDNLTNIENFSRNQGIGILFSQPWNQKRQTIKDLISKHKVFCCDNWKSIEDTMNILNK